MSEFDSNTLIVSKYIKGCDDALDGLYKPAYGDFFRLVHKPITEKDLLPKPLKNFSKLSEEEINLEEETKTYIKSFEDQRRTLEEAGLSGNVTETGLREFIYEEFGNNEVQLQKTLKRLGDHIVKYKLEPQVGLIEKTPPTNGHINLQLFKGVNLEDFRDVEYGFVPFK